MTAAFDGRAQAGAAAVTDQPLPNCWKRSRKKCPGECQYILRRGECMNDRIAKDARHARSVVIRQAARIKRWKICELRTAGQTYREIGKQQTPPISPERVRQILCKAQLMGEYDDGKSNRRTPIDPSTIAGDMIDQFFRLQHPYGSVWFGKDATARQRSELAKIFHRSLDGFAHTDPRTARWGGLRSSPLDPNEPRFEPWP